MTATRTVEAPPRPSADAAVRVFKALSDPVRLRLLHLIVAADGGEICVCDITAEFDLTQPTISHHLKLLREADLVTVEKRGTWSYYRIEQGAFDGVRAVLEGLDGARPAA